jgi:hypothetical protein
LARYDALFRAAIPSEIEISAYDGDEDDEDPGSCLVVHEKLSD